MKDKKVAILQSNYIPWKGYFDIINSVDEFIVYDDVQYTKNDWRNRNRIKTSHGIQWLTIPVYQNSLSQKINQTLVANRNWNFKHWRAIHTSYVKALFFKDYKDTFEDLYINCTEKNLSAINLHFIKKINKILNIKTKISSSTDYNSRGKKTERLISILKQAGATDYITGPSAKEYLDEILFFREDITIHWMDYSGYPKYNQLFPPFDHSVSIIDLIFNEGPMAKNYMKSFNI